MAATSHRRQRPLETGLRPGRRAFAQPGIARLVVSDQRVEPLVCRLVGNQDDARVAEEPDRWIGESGVVGHDGQGVRGPGVAAVPLRIPAERARRLGDECSDRVARPTLQADDDAYRLRQANGRAPDSEGADGKGEVTDAFRAPVAGANFTARGEDTKPTGGDDADIEVRGRRCRPEGVEPSHRRIERPPAAVPGENREERHEPRRAATLEREAGTSRQAQLPRHRDGHSLAGGERAVHHQRRCIGSVRRDGAPTGRYGTDRQTCATPRVEGRVRPQPEDDAVSCNRRFERDGKRARRFLHALTDADVQGIPWPISWWRRKGELDRARERPGLRIRRGRL